MNEAQQEDGILMAAGKDGTVRVKIESSEGVLVDEVLPAKQFSTGSVGWGLQTKASFE